MHKINSEKVKEYLIKRLKDEIEKRGYNRGVVGVSGGLDSAVVLSLLVRSIGREDTIAVIMPYGNLCKEDVRDALQIVEELGVKNYIINIKPMIEKYFENFQGADNKRKGNMMARERMAILYDISVVENALVIGTGNKTEYYLGYWTLFGDGAYAINPIGSLYKTDVRKLAHDLNIPEKIIKKLPSAGLWKGQTDEGELGYRYEDIDELLYWIIEKNYSRDRLVNMGFEAKFVDDIESRIENTRFKRNPPFIIKACS